MFGGYGIYNNGSIFGIIDEDILYFKVNESNKEDYLNIGSKPFSYEKNGKEYHLNYWQIPAEILEDEIILAKWAEKSYRISLLQTPKKKRSKIKREPKPPSKVLS